MRVVGGGMYRQWLSGQYIVKWLRPRSAGFAIQYCID